MATRKRSGKRREADLALISQRYLRGVQQSRIAQDLGVSPQQIVYDLKELNKRWRESQLVNFNEARAIQLAKQDALEQEAWEGWRRSIGKMKKCKLTSTKEKGETRERITWHEAGDPRFLQVIQGCIDKRCKILGLEAPARSELNTNVNVPMTAEERERRIDWIAHSVLKRMAIEADSVSANGHASNGQHDGR